jgi:hypothetical protein
MAKYSCTSYYILPMWKSIFQKYFVYMAMDSPKKSSKFTYSQASIVGYLTSIPINES